MMIPKVTIIIPVYNVEQYLRQCLDSVVNQTMQEIQIICVNDGSPDNSLAILQEYATHDSRIEIVDKPNGGLSSARNAAYPLIKGAYTTFVDSDDWIDLELCEKTYQKAEETGAQMVYFFSQRSFPSLEKGYSYRHLTPGDKTTVEEKLPLLDYITACIKLWRTDFLLGNKLYFPEGLCFEDNLVLWQAITLADKVSVLPAQLYHHRENPRSINQTVGKHVMDYVPIYNKIRMYLLESGYYTAYREEFIVRKLGAFLGQYRRLPTSLQPKFLEMMRESLTDDDREFYRSTPRGFWKFRLCLFYRMIEGNKMDTLKYHLFETVRWLAQFLPQWIVEPLKNQLKTAWKSPSKSKVVAEIQKKIDWNIYKMRVWWSDCILNIFTPAHLRARRSLERRFRISTGKKLNLEQPKTLGEKIQWLKLYYRNPILTELADKYTVRPYVAEKVGEEYLIPLIGVYESVSEIDFKKLPEKFILKATHGCGWNIICKDKQRFDFEDTKRKLTKWLNTNYYDFGLEWQYKDMKPRIVCETLLERPDGRALDDYKIFLFNGVVRYVQVVVGRESSQNNMYFDMNWGRIPVSHIGKTGNGTHTDIPKPEQLDKMLTLARQLTPDVPLVRVDFYIHEGRIYFGELTFTPASGHVHWSPEQYDQIFGDMLVLPEKPYSAESH